MKNNEYILGIDTSNYKTSVAVTDRKKNIICDFREFLKVRQGEKGLRQSDALFQHIKMLPVLMNKIRENFFGNFAAVACSFRPRPIESSYMPVFLAGENFGKSIASALQIPYMGFSHQEGHIEAVKAFSDINDKEKFLTCHFSGGTCELLEVKENSKSKEISSYDIKIIGGSKDISFGQVIDRAGVSMGYDFPSGEHLDELALKACSVTEFLTPVKVSGGYLNLSGIDTQIRNILFDKSKGSVCKTQAAAEKAAFVKEIFEKISVAMAKMICQGAEISGISDILMVGGVSSSLFIREKLSEELKKSGINILFGDKNLSQDNAVGIALLGGKSLWD